MQNPSTVKQLHPRNTAQAPSAGPIFLRLVLFCLVLGASFYEGLWSADTRFLLWSYLVFTLVFLISYRRWREVSWQRFARVAGAVQIVLEISIQGSLLLSSSTFTSPYSLLLLLTIISASLQYRLVGTLLVATVCSMAAVIAVFLGVVGAHPDLAAAKDFSTVLDLNDDLFYALFLYVCTFYLAAFVSGYLSDRLELKDRALEGASRALELARLETDDILQHMQSGLLTLNAAGTLVYFNQSAEQILGLRERDVTGRHFQSVFGHSMPELSELLTRALTEESVERRGEIMIRRSSGNIIPVGISTTLLGYPKAPTRGMIAIFQDLTTAKKLEERARVADRLAAVGELSASIAHEIRNPLATVTGSVQLLSKDPNLDAEGRELMDLILKESARLNRIVEDFLDFARIKQAACNDVDIEALAREVRLLFKQHPSCQNGCQVSVVASHSGIRAAANEEQVKQMLINLVQNGLEAISTDEGEVSIEIGWVRNHSGSSHPQVEITVADNGPGIASDLLDRVGQPFFSTKKKGTGLGLAIVQRLAVASGGSLRWTSERGCGARFTIRLPAFQPEAFQSEVSEMKGSKEWSRGVRT